jgi:DNA invertase Pin-like site-specific DNA recombinase
MEKSAPGGRLLAAVGYVRVSTLEQASEGVSLDAQAARIAAYCQLAGLQLVELIREEGISASIPLVERPAGQRVIAALRQHKAGHVVAFKLDRLFRDAADALNQTRAWDKGGIALHLVDVGGQTINTAAAMGRMFLTMMAGFAELERNLIAERTASALQHKKARREIYNHVPLGFDEGAGKLIENPAEQVIIQFIKKAHSECMPMRRIAEHLNCKGMKGKQGGRFYASTIRCILNNDLHSE